MYTFYLGHPAHYHLFRPTIISLRERGYDIDILCKSKDVLEDLLHASGWDYTNIMPEGRIEGRVGMALGLAKRNLRMLGRCLYRRPRVITGTSPEAAQVGRVLGIPSLIFNEDDVEVVPLFARAAYPFCTAIVAPEPTDLGRWAAKGVRYPGYQKLAYLHPARFQPDRSRVEHLFDGRDQFFILRFVQLTAHHDRGIAGFTTDIARRVVDLLDPHGAVWISAEGHLGDEFGPYRLRLDPIGIHHALSFAGLFVGDSQSMTVESAMLGTPSVRFSDFAGRIRVLEELEHRYGLTVGIPTCEPGHLLDTVRAFLSDRDLAANWAHRRAKMLADKVDLSAFIIWLLEGFPDSLHTVRQQPDFSDRFRADSTDATPAN